MSETITVTLPDELRAALNELIHEEGISSDELISDAVKQYIFLRRFRLLSEKMIPQAEAQGIYTDQDVFDRMS